MLTNQRFIHESGILRRVSDRIEVLDIDDITFEQGIIERLVGVGTIRVMSSDRSHPELLMYGIENVRNSIGTLRRHPPRRAPPPRIAYRKHLMRKKHWVPCPRSRGHAVFLHFQHAHGKRGHGTAASETLTILNQPA